MLITILVLGCSGSSKPDTDSPDTSPGDTHTDTGTSGDGFCAVRAVFSAHCQVCHSAAGASGGLDLETDPYAAVVGQTSATYGTVLVAPKDPDGSLLYLKMTGAQGSAGGVMPPTGALSDEAAVVGEWILAGAPADCGEAPDTGTTTYHPEGWADPAMHGIDAKHQEQTCTDCHGADLGGGKVGVSCDTCHDDGWRTDCTFCHGGTETTTGAPPRDIDNSDTSLSFSAHTVHVTETIHAPFDCTECHSKPTDVLSSGHIFIGDTTPGVAEVRFTAGLSSAGSYLGGGSCSNLYCHGDGRSSGSMSTAQTVDGCTDCHPDSSSGRDAWDTMSGEHEDHLRNGLVCSDCHGLTVSSGQTLTGTAYHVNGTADLLFDGSVTMSGLECNGACHGENHDSRDWD